MRGLAVAVGLLLAGCASLGGAGMVSGVVVTANGAAIPKGAQLLVRLEEQGVADTEAALIGKATVEAEGKAEARFRVQPDAEALKGANRPGWTVRVQQDGRLLFVNDTSHPYEPGKAVRIVVVPVPQ